MKDLWKGKKTYTMPIRNLDTTIISLRYESSYDWDASSVPAIVKYRRGQLADREYY